MDVDNTTLTKAIQNNQSYNMGGMGMDTITEDDMTMDTANTTDMSVLTSAMKTYSNNTMNTMGNGTIGTNMSTAKASVDTKAANTISNMSSDRQMAMESVIADRER